MGCTCSNMGNAYGHNSLNEEDMQFLKEHTALTSNDIALYENFLEKHPEGTISRTDFRPMMLACYPDLDVNTLEKHIFRIFDKDGDGSIDFKEFMVILYVMTNGSAEDNLKQIFRVFDIDRDGRICREEMYRICRDLSYMFNVCDNPKGYHPETIGNMAFMEMDVNHDGYVSMDEFITACLAHEKISTMLTLKIIDIFMPNDE